MGCVRAEQRRDRKYWEMLRFRALAGAKLASPELECQQVETLLKSPVPNLIAALEMPRSAPCPCRRIVCKEPLRPRYPERRYRDERRSFCQRLDRGSTHRNPFRPRHSERRHPVEHLGLHQDLEPLALELS